MAPASDREDELRRLRERVYGPGDAPSVGEIARLRELEEHAAPDTRPEPESLPDPESRPDPDTSPALDTRPDPGTRPDPESRPDPQSRPDPLAAADPDGEADRRRTVSAADVPAPTPAARSPRTRRRTRETVVATISAVLVAGAAFATGFGVGTTSAIPAEPDDFAELLLPQTDDDVVAATADTPIAESVDLSSSRFIARVDGYDVFLARPADAPGVCVFLRVADSDALSGSGCSVGGPGRGAVGFGGVGGLTIHVGDVGAPAPGEPLRLSENVVAYRAG